MDLNDIATFLSADIEGKSDIEIQGVARIEDSREGDITFLANPRYHQFLETTQASAVIVARSFDFSNVKFKGVSPALLRVDDPYLSFLRLMSRFAPAVNPVPPGIHVMAAIDPTADLGKDVRVGAFSVLGERCSIGDGSVIGHNCVIGDDVVIGRETIIYHSVTIREKCKIGSHVILHPGVVIGSDGFGFAPTGAGSYEKVPQLGIVVVEDEVEVGANSTIDRATMGETRIMRGAKLDNLIQVAHNVVIGEDTVIAAQSGISGSTKIGKGGMIGGQVGITGHLSIADKTSIGAQSGVHRSVKEPGQSLFGSPALPGRQAMKTQGLLMRLPDLVESVRQLKDTVARMEERVEEMVKKQKTSAGASS